MNKPQWLNVAIQIAHDTHKGQTDKLGVDYIKHVEAVAKAVEDAGYGAEYIAAAWDHDVIEDGDWTPTKLYFAGIPVIVCEAVQALSRKPGESYSDFILRAKTVSPISRVVKRFDLLHNLSRYDLLPEPNPSLKLRYEKALETLGYSK